MSRPKKPRCISCKQKPGRKLLTSFRGTDGKRWEFTNATKRPIFCSVRCAANHALLWFDWEAHADDLEECGHEK